MMTFWDTVRGHQLADSLIYNLPKLTGKQYTKEFLNLSEMEEYVKEAIQHGHCYLTHILHEDGTVFLVMRK